MSAQAWTAVINAQGCTLGMAELGTAGYSPMREPEYFDSYKAASAEADRRNLAMGLTLEGALEIVIDTMRRQNLMERAG